MHLQRQRTHSTQEGPTCATHRSETRLPLSECSQAPALPRPLEPPIWIQGNPALPGLLLPLGRGQGMGE